MAITFGIVAIIAIVFILLYMKENEKCENLKYDNEKTLYYMKERQIKSETEAAERLGVKVEKVAEFKDGSCLCRMSENVCALAQKQWDEKNSAVNAD